MMMTRFRSKFLRSALPAIVLCAGCGSARSTPDAPSRREPAAVAEPAPASAPETGPESGHAAPVEPAAPAAGETATPGPATAQALLESKCVRCHGLDKIEHEQTDRAGWTAIIDRMIQLGAELTDAERNDLIEHLATRPLS